MNFKFFCAVYFDYLYVILDILIKDFEFYCRLK